MDDGTITAKRKGWQKYLPENQTVTGYPVWVDGRCFVYDKAEMNTYGTIIIKDYVEVEQGADIEKLKTGKKDHNSLCETDTYEVKL